MPSGENCERVVQCVLGQRTHWQQQLLDSARRLYASERTGELAEQTAVVAVQTRELVGQTAVLAGQTAVVAVQTRELVGQTAVLAEQTAVLAEQTAVLVAS